MANHDGSAPDRNRRSARTYASKYGFKVFPLHSITAAGDCTCPPHAATRKNRPEGKEGTCSNAGKHPRTARGLLDATSDLAQIDKWWGDWPDANIGIACGASGFVAIDIDPRNGGTASIVKWEAEHGPMPPGPRATTGGGGEHRLFQMPALRPDEKLLGKLAPGVDVKAIGGYVVAPPSNHLLGAYAWQAGSHPTAKDGAMVLPDLPADVLTAILKRVKASASGSTGTVTEGLLGCAFQLAGDGWWGGVKGDFAIVRCPWEDEHTTGSRFDGSTVVWSPTGEHNLGYWECKHSHCANRPWKDVMAALPEAATVAARLKVPLESAGASKPPPGEGSAEGGARDDWRQGLDCLEGGKLKDTAGNAAMLLRFGEEWHGVLAYNDLVGGIEFRRPGPALPGYPVPRAGSPLRDADLVYVQHALSKRRWLKLGLDMIFRAVEAAAMANTFDPLADYLNGLQWDGLERLPTWTSAYLGVPANTANDCAGYLWMIGAVARALQPGCQMDYTLVLSGGQGGRKSSFARLLVPDPNWALGRLPDLSNEERAIQGIQGKWLVEIAELDAIKGVSLTRVKSFLTQVSDTYRPPYARVAITRPRRAAFLASTNDEHYLVDPTGARRFLPLTGNCVVRRDELQADAPQLLAEAVHRFRAGEQWWLLPEQEATIFGDARAARLEIDDWEEVIAEMLFEKKTEVRLSEVYGKLGILSGQWDHKSSRRIRAIMGKLGWQEERPRDAAGRQYRVWRPGRA